MVKCLKKDRIVRKYESSCGTSLEKLIKRIEITWLTMYTCSFCGRSKVKR
ncbi:unnamed protein product [Gulo gulo]|uniref:Uncharacterized protein n=1 Tax=Gulo gulo TaxID=48420 RepID=A0A9X9M404_GULGU|nr:unnamed protein product [Gulo gulo]